MSMKPKKLTVKAYQVGFGDCFLLTFHYPVTASAKTMQKHVLIDFGSTGRPKRFEVPLIQWTVS